MVEMGPWQPNLYSTRLAVHPMLPVLSSWATRPGRYNSAVEEPHRRNHRRIDRERHCAAAVSSDRPANDGGRVEDTFERLRRFQEATDAWDTIVPME